VPEVHVTFLSGLLDVRLHPDYADNGLVYLSYSKRLDEETATTAVSRGRFDGEAELVTLVNNPDLHTIYLPASQFVFAAIGELIEAGPGAWSTPAGSGRVLRAVLVAVDLGVVGLVLVGLARAGRSPWWAALYAWHPLVLSEVAGSGHQDVLGVAALVAALLLWTGTASTGRRAAGTLVLAGATLVKPVAVLLGPVVARDRPAPNWPAPNLPAQTWIGHGLLGAAGIAALTVGLGLAGGLEGIEHLLETARRFTGKWAHFGAVYETSQWGLETLWPVEDPEVQWRRREAIERAGRVICGLVVIVGAALVLRRPWRTPGGAIDGRWPWAATGRLMLLLVLASTTAHPWYLLWALAAVPVAGSPAIWVASLTVPLGYAALGDPADWTVPGWLLAAAWAPVAAALAVELRAGRHRRSVAASPGHRSAPPPPEQPPEARSPSP